MMLETPSFRQTLPQKNNKKKEASVLSIINFSVLIGCNLVLFHSWDLNPDLPLWNGCSSLNYCGFLRPIYNIFTCIYKYQKHYFLFFNISIWKSSCSMTGLFYEEGIFLSSRWFSRVLPLDYGSAMVNG